MRKILVGIIIMLPFFMHAQNSRMTSTYFGAEVGLNATRIEVDSLQTDRGFTPYFGVKYDYKIKQLSNASRVLFNAGVLYSIRGSNTTSPFYKYRYHQIEVPFGIKYSGLGNLYLNVGLNQSFNVQAIVYKTERSDFNELGVSSFHPSTELYAGFDFSLSLTSFSRTDLSFKYLIPLTDSELSTYRFGVAYYLSEEKILSMTEPRPDQTYYQIIEMKENPVLVRLQASESRIESFQNRGMFREADNLKRKQDSLNKTIMKAFKDTFDFTKVYFFHSSDTRKVLEGEFRGIFLNENLESDTSIKLSSDDFYIVEFAYLASGGGKSIEALVVKDKFFHELEKPFPYFVKRNEIMLTKKDKSMIAELNRNLKTFYKLAKAEVFEYEKTALPGVSF